MKKKKKNSMKRNKSREKNFRENFYTLTRIGPGPESDRKLKANTQIQIKESIKFFN